MYRYVLATIFFIFAAPYFVSAADSFTGMEVKLIYPDNQVIDTEGFFDINAEPNQTTSMDVRIHNKSSKPVTLNVEKTNAYTAPKGGIIYDTTAVSGDAKLLDGAIRLADYIKTEKSITIPAKESADLHVHVTVPELNTGTMLGGIRLTKGTAENENPQIELAEKGTNFAVQTNTSYSIAIKLNLSEKSSSNFSLGKAEFNKVEEQIFLKAVNGANDIQENIEGVYIVMDSLGTELFEGVIDPFTMAPMSNTKIAIPWENTIEEKGTYILMIKGKAGEKEFFEEKPFTIANDAVLFISEKKGAEGSKNSKGNISIVAWSSIVMAFIFVVFFIFKKRSSTLTYVLNEYRKNFYS